MATYLRKSFTFGPFRINLSKSGLGISFGVTGFRVGTGPRGPYVHAGRGGLYFKKSLNQKNEDFENENMNEIVEGENDSQNSSEDQPENIETEPLTTSQKVVKFLLNFIVGFLIFCLFTSFVWLYIFYLIIKVAGTTSSKSRRKRKRRG